MKPEPTDAAKQDPKKQNGECDSQNDGNHLSEEYEANVLQCEESAVPPRSMLRLSARYLLKVERGSKFLVVARSPKFSRPERVTKVNVFSLKQTRPEPNATVRILQFFFRLQRFHNDSPFVGNPIGLKAGPTTRRMSSSSDPAKPAGNSERQQRCENQHTGCPEHLVVPSEVFIGP
jgi:hypothetical protein